ncbi:MAG: RHS repeat-associated core domain-containing protein [Gallionella sp.]
MKMPGSFTLTADAASTTSTIAKVDFYAIDNATNAGTLIGTATQVPYTANWSNVPLGDYTLSAVATDTLNAVTTSSPVTVTVNTGIAQAYYIHTDHLDTPRTITDGNGNIVWQWDNMDPFGNNVPNENPSGLGTFKFDLRFPGQVADKETNTFYNMYRDAYDPALDRYTQSDPIGLEGGINTYAYVGGNPLSYTDPTGLFHMYECWGGSNWSGCASGPDIPANPQPPKDALDACYAQHDYCYAAAQSTGESNSCSVNQSGSPKPSVSSCDAQLAQCLVKVDYSKIDSLWGRIFGPYSTWWAALHARISR